MLGKNQRIPTGEKTEIKKKVFSSTLDLLVGPEEENSSLKLRVVVGKKVDKRAVERNRIKRIIKEEVFKNKDKVAGKTLIVVAKKEASGAKKEEIRQDVKKVLGTAGL